MAKIITAKDYGHRKVVTVCYNPDEPRWVHPNGKPHTEQNGVDARGTTRSGLAAGTECHACRDRWWLQEFIWEGEALFKTVKGEKELKTDEDLLAEVRTTLTETPTAVLSLEGQTI